MVVTSRQAMLARSRTYRSLTGRLDASSPPKMNRLPFTTVACKHLDAGHDGFRIDPCKFCLITGSY